MENKYYIPNIEEFYIGFEYEHLLKENFTECTILCYPDIEDVYYDMPLNKIRVKSLDKDDIKSLGFKKSNKDSWIGYKDYYINNINPEYPYFLYATLHVPLRDDMYKIYVHRYYNENEGIEEDAGYREPTCVFVGKIKNKSELQKLLKQLNIQ